MAGMGKRMRPHTLTTPKPLLPVAGKPIVERLVENISKLLPGQLTEVCFVIGDFGAQVEQSLLHIAERLGIPGKIYHQKEALGTAHAVYCANASLEGPVIVAFADTLFDANFTLDTNTDGIVWVKKIDNPSAFGVVTLNEQGAITGFVEKPSTFVSDLAIIGAYYFKDGHRLKKDIQALIDNKVLKSGEYQLTDILENMRTSGLMLKTAQVDAWMDFGNKNVFIESVSDILSRHTITSGAFTSNDSTIIPPCYLGEGVVIENSTIGPHVSVEKGTVIKGSKIASSVVLAHSTLTNTHLQNSMIGNFVQLTDDQKAKELNIGDYNTLETA